MQAKTRLRKQDRAAELLAEGGRTTADICKTLGVNESTLWRWQQQPEFQAQVEEAREAIRQAIRAEGIANKQNRIDALNHRHQLMNRVITERGQWSQVAGAGDIENLTEEEWIAPGAETGLLVRTVKYTPTGKVVEWAVDTGLLKSLLEHEKQAAIELSQWTERKELSSDPDKPLRVVVQYDDADGPPTAPTP